MTLLAGDLTTPARAAVWMANAPSLPSPVLSQLISSMTGMIYNKLNRARLYSQPFVRTFDGTGNYQLVLPDWPVTAVTAVQVGSQAINPYPLPPAGQAPTSTFGYGYRFVPWAGNLPGDPVVLEFVGGYWRYGAQNVKVTYNAGYLIANEQWTVITGSTPANSVTVQQPLGIWCRDNGVVNTATGLPMVPVTGAPASGQYTPPPDSAPGLYIFNATDVAGGLTVQISYSFIPADLEEACIQMVAERYSYRTRIGEESKSLGGQETVRFMRGGGRGQMFSTIPPEVDALIAPYVSVTPPAIGAPV